MKKMKIDSNIEVPLNEINSSWESDFKLKKSYKRFVKSGVINVKGCYLIKRLLNKSNFSWDSFESNGFIEYFVNEIYLDVEADESFIDFVKISKKIFDTLGVSTNLNGSIVFVLLMQQDHSLLKFFIQRDDEAFVLQEDLHQYRNERLVRITIDLS